MSKSGLKSQHLIHTLPLNQVKMTREVEVRDTHNGETFDALLFEGAENKFTHRGDTFARVAEAGTVGDKGRGGWVQL